VASQLATYSIQTVDPERTHLIEGLEWRTNRRGLGVCTGSDSTVISQHMRRETVKADTAPMLYDIKCLSWYTALALENASDCSEGGSWI
jgi:hypothetical protein